MILIGEPLAHLPLDPPEHGRHAAHAQRRHGGVEPDGGRVVVGHGEHHVGGEPVEALREDRREPAARRGLGRRLRVHVHVAVHDLHEHEHGRLALLHALEEVRVVGVPCRQLGQLVAEVEQEEEPVPLLQREEVVADLGERRGQLGRAGHRAGSSPGSAPWTMGTRTAEPHSVQEPS